MVAALAQEIITLNKEMADWTRSEKVIEHRRSQIGLIYPRKGFTAMCVLN